MVKNDSDCGNHSGWMTGYRSRSNRPAGSNCRNPHCSICIFYRNCNRFCGNCDRVNRSDSSRYWKYVCEYRSRSCTIWSRYDTDCCWCDRNRGRDKTLYHCISRDDQRNCMDSQKTISQEGDGVRYEKKMENILDSMWYMFPGWDHMLWCSVGNWNNTG